MDTGHWLIRENVYLHEDMFGFIYEITNKANGKKYIGKKQCIRKIKRKPLKGKTRNRIDHKESDSFRLSENWNRNQRYISLERQLQLDYYEEVADSFFLILFKEI